MSRNSSGPRKLQLPYILNTPVDPMDVDYPPSSSAPSHRSDDKQRRHPCEKCDLKFYSRGDLQKHIKTVHLKIKDHVCQACGAKFGEKGNLNKHKKRKHDNARDFSCSYPGCPKTFVLKDGLTRHEKIHEKDHASSSSSRLRK